METTGQRHIKTYKVKHPSSHYNARDFIMEVRDNGCHECVSHTPTSAGYTRFVYKGKGVLLHRYRMRLVNPSKLYVLHRCGNPLCSSPEHLYLGDQAQNMQDMMKHGRSTKKLSDTHAMEIYLDTSKSQYKLAAEYGVSQTTVWEIKHKRKRIHIHGDTLI